MSQTQPSNESIAKRAGEGLRDWANSWCQAFDRFWFTPRSPEVLGFIRLFTGMIVFYTHLVWSLELETFAGADAILPRGYRTELFAGWSWSHLDWVAQQPSLFWMVHLAGLLVIAMFALGCWTRVTAVLTALLVISYANRTIGAGFGLDQINVFLCLYCAVGNSGGAISLDRWWSTRNKVGQSRWYSQARDPATNIAIRLIQIHLCIVYFFAALGKLEGDTWWTGEAVWLALASYEYQTLDMTWLAHYLPLVSLMTLASLFWELAYPALIWPRLTRPIMLLLAVLVHLGIGLCMGMMTFAMIMLVANLSFVEPAKANDECVVTP